MRTTVPLLGELFVSFRSCVLNKLFLDCLVSVYCLTYCTGGFISFKDFTKPLVGRNGVQTLPINRWFYGSMSVCRYWSPEGPRCVQSWTEDVGQRNTYGPWRIIVHVLLWNSLVQYVPVSPQQGSHVRVEDVSICCRWHRHKGVTVYRFNGHMLWSPENDQKPSETYRDMFDGEYMTVEKCATYLFWKVTESSIKLKGPLWR